MANNTLDHTLSRAFAALRRTGKSDIQRLALPDCAILLSMLLDTAELAELRLQLARHLCRQLSIPWIEKGDLFEVFSVLTALWHYDQAYINGHHLAASIERLIRCEVAPGGPYYSGNTVETAANLQIAAFARLAAKPLPALDVFLHHTIASGQYDTSPYALYLLATTLGRPEIIAMHRAQTPAHRAVALTTLQDEATLHQELAAISSRQQPNGFWAGEVLQRGHKKSRITTTALIAGILSRYLQATVPVSSIPQRHQMVIHAARQLFASCAEPLKSSALATISKVCHSNEAHEITLLSYFFAKALATPGHITSQQHTLLGAANVCGWVAYTIYDNFLDGDGTPAMLPVANTAMRASLDCFRAALPEQNNFSQYVAQVFTKMDEANAWEISNCRFAVHGDTITITKLPKYGKCSVLATRSFAHALGPMAILAQHPQNTAKKARVVEVAFRHYLIARQLSDDLHDWRDDMQVGQASYVVTAILRDMRLAPGTYSQPALLASMQKQFRRTTMPRICRLALAHIAKSEKAFARSELTQVTPETYPFIDTLRLTLQHTLDQHDKACTLIQIGGA